jgi:uncharacterized protein (UPF0332 family)
LHRGLEGFIRGPAIRGCRRKSILRDDACCTGVLLEKDIERHSHQGVIAAFGQYLVKPGHINAEFRQHFIEAFDLRQESDYEPIAAVSKEQAQKIISRAGEFVEACRKLCN